MRIGIGLTVVGLFVFLLGAEPGLFNLDRSPVFGFVQISVLLIGLALICLGGYISIASLWNGRVKTITADVGQRLVSTGYVITVVAGMADVFGLGSHQFPKVPYFGPWQAVGVVIGVIIIGVGFVLFIPRPTQPRAPQPEPETQQTTIKEPQNTKIQIEEA
jgi:hypothetical protein